MGTRYVHVESIQQARELLYLGLLYENHNVGVFNPRYHLCDDSTPVQLDELESGEPTNWPLSDYVYLLED